MFIHLRVVTNCIILPGMSKDWRKKLYFIVYSKNFTCHEKWQKSDNFMTNQAEPYLTVYPLETEFLFYVYEYSACIYTCAWCVRSALWPERALNTGVSR